MKKSIGVIMASLVLAFSLVGTAFAANSPHSVPDPVTVIGDPPVQKQIDGDNPPSAAEFSFSMTPTDPSFPLPGGASDQAVVTVVGEGQAEFGNITFVAAGVYTYEVAEAQTDVPGYYYDSTVYTVRYDVTEVDGKLECTRTFSGGATDVMTYKFTNVYDSKAASDGRSGSVDQDGNKKDGSKLVQTGDMLGTSVIVILTVLVLVSAVVLVTARRKSQRG